MRESVMTANFDRKMSTQGENGSRLESEFLGEVNKMKYKELTYALLHKDELEKAATPDKKFEIMMKIRDEAQHDFQSILKSSKQGKFIDLKTAVNLVEQSQAGNPEKPSKFFSAALLNHLKDRFSDKYILKFFTAAGGTHLDVLHGVDGFFKLYDKSDGQELATSTIDITMNPTKDRSKADVIIYVSRGDLDKLDPSRGNKEFDKKKFQENIEKNAEEIIESLISNYQKNT